MHDSSPVTSPVSVAAHRPRHRLRMVLVGGIATVTIAGALSLGATASAGGPGDGLGSTPERAARICANHDEIHDWITSRIEEVNRRLEYFRSMRARAEAAGRTELVERIDRAIARLNDRLARLQERLAKLDEWVATHCDPPPTTEPSSTAAAA
jgi:hypothetical protein